jgi:hypothetical protein
MPVIELQNFRSKYPDYNDMDDATLAGKLAEKYPDAYGDLPQRVGMAQDVVVRKDNERIVTNPYRPDFLKTVKDVAGPELYKKSKNALTIAATHDIAPDAAFTITDEYAKKVDESNLYDKAVGSFKAGWGDIYSSIGGILKRKDIGGTLGDTYLEFGEKLKHAYIPPSDQSEFTWRKMIDPEWYATTAMRSVPFGISLVPAAVIGAYGGGAVGTAIGLGKFGVTVLGAIGGASLSRPVESALEAQGAHEEAIQKGMTPDEAEEAANRVFWDNMKLGGLDAAEFATAFLPMGKVAGSTVKRSLKLRSLAAVGKLAGVGAMEAGEERYQEKTVMDALGDPASFFDMSNPRLNEASAAGAVFGVGLGGAGSVWTALTDRVTKTMPEPVKQVYEQAKKEGQSDIQALDTVAETPEGKQHIETVIQEMKDIAEGKEVKTVQQIENELPPIDETTETDLDTLMESLNTSETDIDENTLLSLLPDVSGDAVKTQQQEELTPQNSIIDNIKAFNDSLGERGSISGKNIIRKTRSFKTEEGNFSVYDTEKDPRGRANIFTVLEDKNGFIVRNAFVPENLQQQGIATDFYIRLNNESLRKTGNPLRSTQPRTLMTGETVHEISELGIKLWDGLVRKGYAEKLGEKDYRFIVSKTGNPINNESGFIDLTPIIDIGRSVWLEGKQTYDEFVTRIKEVTKEIWDKIEPYIKDVWNTLANERGSVKISEVSSKEGPGKSIKTSPEVKPEGGNFKIETIKISDIEWRHRLSHTPSLESSTEYKNMRGDTAEDPIIITSDNHVIDGAGRYSNWKAEGRDSINAIRLDIDSGELEDAANEFGVSQSVLRTEIAKVVYENAGYEKRSQNIAEENGDYFTDERAKELLYLPNPSRSPGEGEQSNIVASIKNTLNEKGSVDLTPLVELGHTIWSEGSQSLESFTTRAKELLGDTWDKVKDFITQVWEQVKAINEKLGERGSISNKELRSVIPTSKVKSVIRRNTGQVSLARLVREDEALRAAFTKAAQAARVAYRAGNKEGVEEQKAIIKTMLNRRSLVKNVRDYFGLSDDDLRKISRKNPLLMDDLEFKHYMQDIEELSVYYAEKAQAKFELMLKIESKRLKKVENFREAMEYPAIPEMTTKQLREFAELLEPYQEDDTFLGKRQLEMIDRTDLKGIRTWREARERLAQETGIPILELADIHVGALDSFRWDSALREQNPFYDFLVTKMTESMMGADLQFHDVETKAYKLAKKADKSHGRSLADKAIPTDEKVMMFLESPDDAKEMIAKSMTPEQLDYAHFMQTYFKNALDYLLTTKALERGRENYFVHIRKTFLENTKEKGILTAFKEMFRNFEEDQAVFKILDDSTGEILPLEKFFQFALHRAGYLDPTTNVTRAFLTYARTFERKRMFDGIIDKMDIYAQSLTPETYTETGLETDRTLKKFVYQYINNKKGRKLSYEGALKQGGPVDMAIRGIRTFTTVLDLGLSPITQGATFVGEQVATAVMLGPKVITKATARMKTDKGKRIIEKYEAFTGRSFWEEFTAPGKEVTERLTETLFAGFHISNVLANKQFLLGSLTDQEWNSEEITTERLAEMKLDMGRFRPVPGTNSLVGSTSIGNAVMQYKTWAVSMSRNVLVDIGRFTKDLKNKPAGEALTTREAKELYRIVGITSAAIIVGAMAGADEDDKTMLGKLRTRAYKEAMSLTQGMNPAFWLSTPRILTWAYQTATALKQIITLEEYKTKEGYKGVNNLEKQVIPRTIRDLAPDQDNRGRK